MAVNVLADFFGIIDTALFENASILLIICYIIWETPRTVKILSEEYTHGLYPEGGRVIDFVLFVIGFGAAAFMMSGGLSDVITFLKKPGITAFFLIIMVVVILIMLLGFLKRFFPRFDGNSVTVFMLQGFLDLMRTVFYISLAILFIPTLGYFILGA
jgi:hypothetical protein